MNYKQQIKEALNSRKSGRGQGCHWLVIAISLFTFVYCISSVIVVPGDKAPDFNFQEGGAITALSAVYLSLACGFSIACALIYKKVNASINWLWVILALGFGFLAFDELLQFHERFDRLVFERLISKDIFSGWNDAIVVMYGVIAIPVMIVLLPKILKYRMVLELFALSFCFYFVHTFIDSVQEEATFSIVVVEESAKLFSVAFLALGSFVGLMNVISVLSPDMPAKDPKVHKESPAKNDLPVQSGSLSQ